MSLVGNLEDLPLADILQIVSLSRRTGILTIETEEGKSIIVFKNGLIVSAACPSPQVMNLGQILMERKLITQSRLHQLLEIQKSKGNEPLGSIVVQASIIDKETLEQIIKNQIKQTIYLLMNKSEGSFSFDLSEVIPFDDIRYNPLENTLERGLNPQQLLLDGARISDEQKRDVGQATDTKQELPVPEPQPKPFSPEFDISPAPESFSFADIREPEAAAPVRLEDLQLPESSELPDIAFDQFAEQLDFGSTGAPPEPAVPAPSAPAVTFQPVPLPPPPLCPALLVVDDEALFRQVMSRRFEEKGYEVFQSDNPRDAIEKAGRLLEAHRDLQVVSDLVMPTSVGNGFLGGLEIVEGIRRISSLVPVIIITDYEDQKAQTRAFSLGVHNFHRKPVLSKSSIKEAEEQIFAFSDYLLEAFKQPPHQFRPPIQEDFWGDLGIETPPPTESPASATNMVRQMTALRQILQELRNPNEAPEISLLILRYAAEFFDRGLLFLVKKDEVDGLGGFGDTGETDTMPQKVRRIKVPLSEDSIFSRVIKRKQTHIGKLTDTPWNRRLISMTGHLIPTSIAMLPLISGNEVIAMLYGDNAVTRRPIKDLEGLEIFMVQAGIAMENALLHRKIKTLKFK